MPKMQTFKVNRQFTVLGPCPGCVNWTLEYADDVVQDFVWFECDGLDLRPNLSGWHAAVERIFQDHLTECPGLREIMFDTV